MSMFISITLSIIYMYIVYSSNCVTDVISVVENQTIDSWNNKYDIIGS